MVLVFIGIVSRGRIGRKFRIDERSRRSLTGGRTREEAKLIEVWPAASPADP